MPGNDVIEGEATEVRSDLAVRPTQASPVLWSPPQHLTVAEAVDRVKAKREFFEQVMREGEHYGSIPGSGTKKVLLKPGAELLLSSMPLFSPGPPASMALTDAEEPIRDYGDGEREGEISYRRVCSIYRQLGMGEQNRMLVAQAEGFCTSRESKYRWRESKRKCPTCGQASIIKGKAEYGGGWLCFKKQGGCGAKFDDTDAAITAQVIGRVPNPDIADAENTILKMADKRALVAATLIATGCSDIFTQDLDEANGDDTAPPSPAGDRTAHAAAQPAKAQPAAKEPAKNAVPADLGSFFDQDETPIFVPPAADDQAAKRAVFARLKEHDADTRLNANDRMRLYMSAAGVANRTNLKSLDAAKRVLAAYENAFKDLNEADAALETAIQTEVPM